MTLFRAGIDHKLPAVVEGIAGPITVGRPPAVVDEKGHPLFGEWRPLNRHLVVLSTLDRRAAWVTFYHELVHSWLQDTGVTHMLTKAEEESTCETVALGLLKLMEGPR